MGTAYTPGLTVSSNYLVTKHRRLPIDGEILVEAGQTVSHDTIVARAELPGDIEPVRLAERMQLDPDELRGKVRVEVGQNVKRGDLLAESSGLFGLFRSEVKSPIDGVVEFFIETTGHLGIRRPPSGIEVNAYLSGRVVAVDDGQGVTIEARGAFIQGIFGVGGERHGKIKFVCESPDEVVDSIDGDLEGKILIAGAQVTQRVLRQAASGGAVGVVAGGIMDNDLGEFVGEEIGVAITGDEDVPFTLIVTEGFGRIQMAGRTFALLRQQEGRFGAINGATQIRAGALRPEIIVPLLTGQGEGQVRQGAETGSVLAIGTTIRAVRQPHFGEVGTVTGLPPDPVRVASGAVVRVLKMKLGSGEEVMIPRSNVEIIGTH
ncbi:MAG: hypothetical protein O3B01_20715 [Planctomycetota bacterium]|nr:hypothetical protein [Planctomycetota bacterium]MDA1140996.1 hypothetical protein [Planctomycetota bacterium]